MRYMRRSVSSTKTNPQKELYSESVLIINLGSEFSSESDALFQALYAVLYSGPTIAPITHPSTKRSSLVAVVEMEMRGGFTTALTKVVSRPLWAVLFAGRGRIAASPRTSSAPGVPPTSEDALVTNVRVEPIVTKGVIGYRTSQRRRSLRTRLDWAV
jgi:hypothetical protein